MGAIATGPILAVQSEINPKTGARYKCDLKKRDYSIKYGRQHVEKKANWRRAWRTKNKATISAKRAAYRASLQAKGGKYVIENRWRMYFYYFLRINHVPKTKTYHFGCTPQEARAHIADQFQPGMDWSNRGTVWHVDHIRPIHTFNLLERDQVLAAFHYTNTRPRWRTVNMAEQPRRLP